jgi:hypothetical protein
MMRAKLLALVFLWCLTLPVAGRAELLNLWTEFEPGKPYLEVVNLDWDYDGPTWWYWRSMRVHPDAPFALTDVQWWATGIWGEELGLTRVRFDYEAENLWRHPRLTDWTGVYVPDVEWRYLEPSWPYWYEQTDAYTDWPDRFDLPYPYHDLGTLNPGDTFVVYQQWDFSNWPSSLHGQIGPSLILGSAIPEPGSVVLLSTGLLALLLAGLTRRFRARRRS